MDEERRYERAKKRIEELKAYYTHLTAYISVNIMLMIINIVTSPDEIWFIFPLLGWGIGITIHTVVIILGGKPGSSWEDKKIKQLMDKYNEKD